MPYERVRSTVHIYETHTNRFRDGVILARIRCHEHFSRVFAIDIGIVCFSLAKDRFTTILLSLLFGNAPI